MIYNSNEDTVAALATAGGTGAIACIRVSGRESVEIVSRIFFLRKGNFSESASGRMRMGSIMSGNELLDEALAVIFRSPGSYTGEDVVEISCHGSQYIVRKILSLLIENGCRLARPGEYTQRAFLNGKMDLSQAEAVADLIASSSASAHRIALNQMRGGFSNKLRELRTELLDFVSLIELELDFSEEDVEFADRNKLSGLVSHIAGTIDRLVESFEAGNAIKNGIPVAIVGETNTGKSTLLNLLLHDEKAIVSEIHGTTRDAIEDCISIGGILFRFIDTAGIRETRDAVETVGIERTFRKIGEADIVLWLVDVNSENARIEELAKKILPPSAGKKLILVFNKLDCAEPDDAVQKEHLLADSIPDRLFISARHKINIDRLENALVEAGYLPETDSQDVTVTNVRHFEALKNARQAILRVENGLAQNIPGELLSRDIRECMGFLGEITGEISTDEILGNIFGKFCIGK
ncbi:MAG: tRNA uridine-5-carboxymethylaminomethyl(34) synthesis GTPase MnmE [Prevotellaceae bacterium]|jgi:tRNA modification GTPase|nr:tRNA uridine-5-carboxymethylaminomethyl(34) synthesis GTPase MnmE [Prevotellaceae bacterium]